MKPEKFFPHIGMSFIGVVPNKYMWITPVYRLMKSQILAYIKWHKEKRVALV